MSTFILGPDDSEMTTIESLLNAGNFRIAYALDAQGNRVTSATAYNVAKVRILADKPEHDAECETHSFALGDNPVWVECAPPDSEGLGLVVVDHHRPGDTGFGKPPAEYWQAASIGQVAALLGIEPTPELRLVAAADHCLAAAYAGQCPGVDPAQLAEYRIEQLCSVSRASNRGEARTPDQVRASIERAKATIVAAPLATIGSVCDFGVGRYFYAIPAAEIELDAPYPVSDIQVADLRGPQIPDLPEAAMILGVGYLAGGVSLREGDPAKIVIGGCGEGTIPGTAPVQAFLEAARNGNVAGTPVHTDGELKPYGDSVRGFAGAYVAGEQ